MDRAIITDHPPSPRMTKILFVARLGLWLEAALPHFICVLSILLLGWAAGLLRVPDLVPGWLHILALLIWGATLIWALRRLGRHCWQHRYLPAIDRAVRMIEQRQQIPHRALSTLLLDRPVEGGAADVWDQHIERLRPLLARVRVPLPCADMPAHDPYALRFVPVLAMVLGIVGGVQPLEGLVRWLNPGGVFFDTAPTLSLDAWITPPDYTGLAPIMLAQAQNSFTPQPHAAPLRVPANSVFHGRITASRHTPALVVDRQPYPFAPAGDDAFQIEQPLTEGADLTIKRGHRIWASWPMVMIADQAPTITQLSPPKINQKQQLVLDYAARDDYGLVGLDVDIQLEERIEGTETAPPAVMALGHHLQKDITGPTALDIVAHPWAGLPVRLSLRAQDALNQRATTPPIAITLPERAFSHPTAKLLMAERRVLTLWPRSKRMAVADHLEQLIADDAALQAQSSAVIALAALNRQLRQEAASAGVADPVIEAAQDLLWTIALQLDQQQLEQKSQQLADAQKALEDALADPNTSRAALEPLIDAVEQALYDVHSAIMNELKARLERGETLPELPLEAGQMILDQDAIRNMMNRLRDTVETASRDHAQQMLDNLNKMLEQLQQGMNTPQNADPQQAALQKLFYDLDHLRTSQQNLSRDLSRAKPTPENMAHLLARQQQLRQKMGDAMLESDALVGMMPPELGEAEQAMAEAIESLSAKRQGRALTYMAETQDALNKIMDSLQGGDGMAGMAGRSGQKTGMGVARPLAPAEEGRDPLGRKITQQGSHADQKVTVPGDDANLARDILNELRRRAGGMNRPEQERLYLKRLLEQF